MILRKVLEVIIMNNNENKQNQTILIGRKKQSRRTVFFFCTRNAGSCLLTPSDARWVTANNASAFHCAMMAWHLRANIGIPFKVNVGSKQQELSNILGYYYYTKKAQKIQLLSRMFYRNFARIFLHFFVLILFLI